MAKETKTERAARLDHERTEHEQKMKVAYPLRLMKVLERATKRAEFELTVVNNMFCVVGPRGEETWELSYDFLPYWNDIESLEFLLQEMDDSDEEHRRHYQVCTAALEKLSKTEREALSKMFSNQELTR